MSTYEIAVAVHGSIENMEHGQQASEGVTTLTTVQADKILKFIKEFIQKDPSNYYDTVEAVSILDDYKEEMTYQLMGIRL